MDGIVKKTPNSNVPATPSLRDTLDVVTSPDTETSRDVGHVERLPRSRGNGRL